MSRDFKIVKKDGTGISAQIDPRSRNARVSLNTLFDPSQFDFHVRTRETVRMARKLEAELVKGYRQWLKQKPRELKKEVRQSKYGHSSTEETGSEATGMALRSED